MASMPFILSKLLGDILPLLSMIFVDKSTILNQLLFKTDNWALFSQHAEGELSLLTKYTLSLRDKQPSISNFFETSQPLRKIKQLTSF